MVSSVQCMAHWVESCLCAYGFESLTCFEGGGACSPLCVCPPAVQIHAAGLTVMIIFAIFSMVCVSDLRWRMYILFSSLLLTSHLYKKRHPCPVTTRQWRVDREMING